ncbi:unnamed protein product [Effrenium voratum]|nr:unnamed protein product [Effrenium voratum]
MAHLTPSLQFLQSVKSHCEKAAWAWIPWRRILSDAALVDVQGRRGSVRRKDFAEVVAEAAGLCDEEWDLDIAGGPHRVFQLLCTRAHAYALCSGGGHLHNWVAYAHWFLDHYARRPGSGWRSASAQEAEEADREILGEVFRQVHRDSVSLDDALSAIVRKDFFRHHLYPRPKLVLKPAFEEQIPAKKRKGAPDQVPCPDKRMKLGECFLWKKGKCKRANCRHLRCCGLCGDAGRSSEFCPKASSGIVDIASPAGPAATGGVAAARARWGNNVVLEKVRLPSLTSLQQFLSLPGASGEEWSCFAFDMRGAHKTILANEAEQGLSSFVFNDTWYTYRSCFFVAKWAPYWFARLGAQLVRFLHSFIFLKHAVFLYVDDGLILMPSKIAPLVSCCVILFFEALGVPLSWEKLHLGKEIPWLGWGFNFTLRVALLPADKVSRIVQMLQPLLVAGQRVERKSLEQVIGLLLWYTTGARMVTAFLRSATSLCLKEASSLPCAADAFATADAAGIGGWWVPPGAVEWFIFALTRDSLPAWFRCPSTPDLQKTICALEALAQLVLLVLRAPDVSAGVPPGYTLVLRQLCDNMGVVCSTAKQLSLKEPLCFVLQAVGFHSCRLGLALSTSHVSGERSQWADSLSRGTLESFNPERRSSLDICKLLEEPWQ